jgi:hypothetical protein
MASNKKAIQLKTIIENRFFSGDGIGYLHIMCIIGLTCRACLHKGG